MYRWLSDQERAEARSRRIYLPLLALGGLGALLGWQIADITRPVDYLLPIIGLAFAVLFVLLWLERISISTVKICILAAASSYHLLSMMDISFTGAMFREGLSATVLWYPVVFPIAYVFLPQPSALRFSLAFYLATVAIGIGGLLMGYRPASTAINSIVQFYLACLTFFYVQVLYSNYRWQYIDMHQLAHTDSLTGLANRRLMQEQLEKQCALAARGGESFSVLLVDLDHFKRINDEYGHATGDQVLREVALLLNGVLREYDTVARWGGEEFLILAPNTTLAQAGTLAERILQNLGTTRVAGEFTVTASLGLACYQSGDDAHSLIRRADLAMYRAKAAGRNRLEVEA